MSESPGFGSFLAEKVDMLLSPDGAFQLGIILVCVLGAWLLKRTVSYRLQFRTREPGVENRRDMLASAASQLLFPAATLAFMLIARGIVSRMQAVGSWLDTGLILLAAWLVIRIAAFTFSRTSTDAQSTRSAMKMISVFVWGAVVLHLLGWLEDIVTWMDQAAIVFGETRFSLLTVLRLIVSIAVLLLAAQWLSKIVERQLERSHRFDVGTRIGIAKFSRFTLLALAILSSLRMAGIDLTALAVFGGALGVGLGFGLQRIASNIVSGIILVFDRSIRPGDVVTVGDSMGEIKALRARYVVVRSRDGVETLIPNETLITTNVINWTYSDRRVRVKIPVQISYSDDPEQAMRIMLDAARANSRVIQDPQPVCLLTAFADNGINLELRVWIGDPEEGLGSIRSEVYLSVWREFKKQQITIPFPQRDVYIKASPAPNH